MTAPAEERSAKMPLLWWCRTRSEQVFDLFEPLDGRRATFMTLLSTLAAVVGPVLLGRYIHKRHRRVEALRERAERLERELNLLAEPRLAAQRSRIAREMHDALAHHIGLAVIYCGALEVGAEGKQSPEVRRIARQIGDANRLALRELREVIGVLRSADSADDEHLMVQPTLERLPALIEDVRRAGLPVVLRTQGTAKTVPGTVGRAVYRIVQESLSNAHKHAGQVETEVTVVYAADAVEVRILNAGPCQPIPARLPGGGHGLRGMHERVSLLGGELVAGPRQGVGFEVQARIPIGSTSPAHVGR